MSKRRELQKRIATLGEINEIFDAMRGLALVESRKIGGFIAAQRAAMAVIETTAADFLADRPMPEPYPAGDVLCVIGSEHGFCGDFNARLAEAAQATLATVTPPRTLLIGNRLAGHWPGTAVATISGAKVVEEVPQVMQSLIDHLTAHMDGQDEAASGLVVLHHGNDGIAMRRLLPMPQPSASPTHRSHALELNLPPQAFYNALTKQYLRMGLQAVLYDSLMAENEQRLVHMEQALDKLKEQLGDLTLKQNRARQEEITEEIEIILLNTELA